MAVGSYETGSGDQRALVERYDGAGWRLEVVPSPGAGAVLRSVACAAASWCVAVGSAGASDDPAQQEALLETWDGGRWWLGGVPALPRPSSFESVECRTATSCKAVGWSSASGVATPFVDSWDGHGWRLVSLPFPSQGANDGGFLRSIACPGPSRCLAAGLLSTNDGGDGTATLAEAWSGAAWKLLDTPSPEVLSGDMSALQAIACPAVATCFAAGSYARGNVFNTMDQTLVEAWNGSAWSQVPAAALGAGRQSALSAIACPGATLCLAAGWSADAAQSRRGLVETWNGRSWSVASGLGDFGEWRGLSCPQAELCLLAGSSFDGADPLGHAAAAWWHGPGTSA